MKRLFFFLVLLFLSGCAGKVGESFVGPLPEKPAVERIVSDAVERLAVLYPPGKTAVQLMTPNQSDAFSALFEQGLRNKGFTASSTGSVRVAWVLDELKQEKIWYLRLRIADSNGIRTLSRAYGIQGEPSAGFAETME